MGIRRISRKTINMKIIGITIIVAFLLNFCSAKPEVLIKLSDNTISSGDTIKALLYVKHADSILPAFNVVMKGDTFLLPFYPEKKHAVFQSIGRTKGKMQYNGFVEFISLDGEKRNVPYLIEYFVE